MCTHVCGLAHFVQSVLSYLYMGSGDQTGHQASTASALPMEPSHWPMCDILKSNRKVASKIKA